MTKFLSLFHSSHILTISLAAICLGISIGLIFWSASAEYIQETDPIITNQTNSLRVLSAKRKEVNGNSFITIKLQNVSSKNIKAYTIVRDKNSWMTEDSLNIPLFTINELKEVTLPFDVKKQNLVIAAVYFEDGIGEGDPRFVEMIKSKHAGMRDQARRILPQIRKLLALNTDSEKTLSEFETEVLQLPINGNENSSSPDYESGLNFVKEKLTKTIQSLKTKNINFNRNDFNKEVSIILATYEKVATEP